MPSRAHWVPAWLAAPHFPMPCGAAWPLGRWPSLSEEPALASRRLQPSILSWRPKADLSAWVVGQTATHADNSELAVGLGVDGDRLLFDFGLDRRRTIGGFHRAPQLRPPRVLRRLTGRSFRGDLGSAAERLAVGPHDSVADLPRHHPTEP